MDTRSDWSHPPQRDSQSSPSSFHFELGMHIGETNSQLRTLTGEVRELPERIAMHLSHELRQWGMVPTATPKSGFAAALKHSTALLQSGLPYVHLVKRSLIALILLSVAVIGNYNPDLAKQMAVKAVGLILGQ